MGWICRNNKHGETQLSHALSAWLANYFSPSLAARGRSRPGKNVLFQ
jgi:hypothetical protein